jgi:hypothetical protein
MNIKDQCGTYCFQMHASTNNFLVFVNVKDSSGSGRGRALSLHTHLSGRPELFISRDGRVEEKTVNSTVWTSTKIYRAPEDRHKLIIMKTTLEEIETGDESD